LRKTAGRRKRPEPTSVFTWILPDLQTLGGKFHSFTFDSCWRTNLSLDCFIEDSSSLQTKRVELMTWAILETTQGDMDKAAHFVYTYHAFSRKENCASRPGHVEGNGRAQKMTKRTRAISSILYNHFPILATIWFYNTLRSHSIAWIEGGTPDKKGKRLCCGSWLWHVIVRASRKRSHGGSNESTRKISLWVERVVSEGKRKWWKPFYFFSVIAIIHLIAITSRRLDALHDHGAHSLSVWRAFRKFPPS
jgi:hypothetical protein